MYIFKESPSVCLSKLGGNAIFSVTNLDRVPYFSVQIPFIYKHLLSKHFVRRSLGQDTKGRNIQNTKT